MLSSGQRHVQLPDLMKQSARVAAGLRSLGIGFGDSLAMLLYNDIAFFEASFGAGMLGAYPVALNWHLTPPEIEYILGDCDAKALLVHADLIDAVRSVVPQGMPVLAVSTPPEICDAYGIAESRCVVPDDLINWDDWTAKFEPWAGPVAVPPGAIIYTSGTTGRPKGVRRFPPSREQALAQETIFKQAFGLETDPDDIVTIVTGPMYHSAPNRYAMLATKLGCDVMLMPRFDAESLLALIERHRVTHLHMVPVMFNRLLRLAESVRQKYDLSSLRWVVHAAAPCPLEIKRQMIDWWGPVINEYYACTETSIVTFCNTTEWLAHSGTVGKPVPEAEVRIIDERGSHLPTGSVGEIVCRNHAIADFTYHGHDADRKAMEKNGLLSPGDVGFFDEDGFLHLTDRSRDMIVSGGVNIYPAEIEAALHALPAIADCAVFGIPDEEFGESVCAVVQPQQGESLTAQDVQGYLRQRIASFKIPRKIEFREDLPREDSGKIFKRKLREPYWADLQRQI